jgi:hypothetical protein
MEATADRKRYPVYVKDLPYGKGLFCAGDIKVRHKKLKPQDRNDFGEIRRKRLFS